MVRCCTWTLNPPCPILAAFLFLRLSWDTSIYGLRRVPIALAGLAVAALDPQIIQRIVDEPRLEMRRLAMNRHVATI